MALLAGAIIIGGVIFGTGTAAATAPDSKVTKIAEAIPVTGYVASAVHGIKGDHDRAKRAAAKCTGSTVVSVAAIGSVAAAPVVLPAAATASAAAGITGAAATAGITVSASAATAAGATVVAAGAGAAGGAVGGAMGVFSESQIAKHIEDDDIKQQCKQGTAKDYATGIGMGAIKGVCAGAADGLIEAGDAALDVGIDAAKQTGDAALDVGVNVTHETTTESAKKMATAAIEEFKVMYTRIDMRYQSI